MGIKKDIKEALEKTFDNERSNCGNLENGSVTSNNGKVKFIWKILVIALLGAGVALGCCDVDCISMHLVDILGF